MAAPVKFTPPDLKPPKVPGAPDPSTYSRPVEQKSMNSPQVQYPRTRAATVKPIAKNLRAAQRVGKLEASGQMKISSRREQVRGHTRKTRSGKIVIVKPHSRKGEPRKPVKEIKPIQVTTKTKTRQQRDLELWKRWKDGGKKKEDIRPLIKQFRGMLRQRANVYVGKVPIPEHAIRAEFLKQFLKALDRYDPERGVGLGTWVYSYLDAATRFITTNQNVAKIPEPRVHNIGRFQRAHADLDDVLGRNPTPKELSDYLGWRLKDVTLLQREMRRGLVRSEFEEDPTSVRPSEAEEVLKFYRYHLSGTDQDVYDYLMGFGGKKQTNSTGEIARALGLSMSKVSRIRAKLSAKIEEYLS